MHALLRGLENRFRVRRPLAAAGYPSLTHEGEGELEQIAATPIEIVTMSNLAHQLDRFVDQFPVSFQFPALFFGGFSDFTLWAPFLGILFRDAWLISASFCSNHFCARSGSDVISSTISRILCSLATMAGNGNTGKTRSLHGASLIQSMPPSAPFSLPAFQIVFALKHMYHAQSKELARAPRT
jgi:hypothetical protein